MLSPFSCVSEKEQTLLSGANSYTMPNVASSVHTSHLLMGLDSSISPSLLNISLSFSLLSAFPLLQRKIEHCVLGKLSLVCVALSAIILFLCHHQSS